MNASETKGWYTRINTVLSRHGLAQVAVPALVAGQTVITAAHFNNIRTAIENQKKDEYLKTLNYSALDPFEKDITQLSGTKRNQIETNVLELESAICRNKYNCTNGTNSNGSYSNGSDSYGTDSNGKNSNGSNTNGSHGNGKNSTSTNHNGTSADGWIGYLNGYNIHGTHSNGSLTNGSNSNGSNSNGTKSNGSHSNGSNNNGTCSNGTRIDVKNTNTK